jgi:hypothetical protein
MLNAIDVVVVVVVVVGGVVGVVVMMTEEEGSFVDIGTMNFFDFVVGDSVASGYLLQVETIEKVVAAE